MAQEEAMGWQVGADEGSLEALRGMHSTDPQCSPLVLLWEPEVRYEDPFQGLQGAWG